MYLYYLDGTLSALGEMEATHLPEACTQYLQATIEHCACLCYNTNSHLSNLVPGACIYILASARDRQSFAFYIAKAQARKPSRMRHHLCIATVQTLFTEQAT